MKIALRGQFFSEMWKHMSDVFKLMASGNIMNLIALSGNMKKDVAAFVAEMEAFCFF